LRTGELWSCETDRQEDGWDRKRVLGHAVPGMNAGGSVPRPGVGRGVYGRLEHIRSPRLRR
jgi:hypothetical protein